MFKSVIMLLHDSCLELNFMQLFLKIAENCLGRRQVIFLVFLDRFVEKALVNSYERNKNHAFFSVEIECQNVKEICCIETYKAFLKNIVYITHTVCEIKCDTSSYELRRACAHDCLSERGAYYCKAYYQHLHGCCYGVDR